MDKHTVQFPRLMKLWPPIIIFLIVHLILPIRWWLVRSSYNGAFDLYLADYKNIIQTFWIDESPPACSSFRERQIKSMKHDWKRNSARKAEKEQ